MLLAFTLGRCRAPNLPGQAPGPLSLDLPPTLQKAHLSAGLSMSLLPWGTLHHEAATLNRGGQALPHTGLGVPVGWAEHQTESGDLGSSLNWPLTGCMTLLAGFFLPHLYHEGSALGSLSGQKTL